MILKVPTVLRLYRAAVLLLVVWLVHEQVRWSEARRGNAISLRQARKFFPAANRVQLRDTARGLYYVTDARGDTIGCLLTTSPFTDRIIGYSGPNNLLVALDREGAVAGLELLQSGDTPEHVQRVRRDPRFLRSFLGWKPDRAAAPKIEGVSGATLTSYAIAEALQERLSGAAPSLRFPDPVTLEEVRALFADAVRLVPESSRLRVLNAAGGLLGFALRTSPQADNVPGYRGPTECLVGLAPDARTVVGVRLRRSYDTEAYVDQVRRAEGFLKRFVGRNLEELAGSDFAREKIEGVSGATLTARAVAEGVRRRFETELNARAPAPRWRPKPRDWGLAAVVAGALMMSFTSLRGHRAARLAWQLLLVGYVGAVNHDFLSLAVFGGWAANGLAFKTAPGLILLVAAALLVPWTSRRQLYCHQICPHGAAQQLLGRFLPRRWSPPAGLTRLLEMVPVFLLGIALLALLLGAPLDLASLEPFDAWVWGAAGGVTLIIAAVGLGVSLFIPQAYCRFGCPTGALLSFVRTAGSSDRWGRRDWTALALLGAGLAAVIGARSWPHSEPEPEPATFRGRTMGISWSLKIRDEIADPALIERVVAEEFDWADLMISHWKTNTDLSEFNRTATTNAMPVPWPVLTLAREAAEISRATDGAYDITVGALTRLWGFGPGPRRAEPPADAEIQAALPAVGWQKLELLDGMIRKQHPALQVDLSSIGEGWAIDQIARLLERRGYTNFLVELGGELRARGAWTISIEHPTRTCTLTNESIGTSGTYRQNFQSGGRRYSHLIDPHAGRPVTHHTVSVSVRHADCTHADAWATALNVLGVETGLPLAERLGLAAQFVVELADGRLEVRQSSAWTARAQAAEAGTQRKP
jgi:thiamine biosynthesis lipoprotein ApbE/Na+-translocating ferredoxin:NAD+ oxidoreductase RnfG subunit